MWFQRLDIHDLRNLEEVHLDLCPGLNYLHGENGAGKTAVLEAVHLLARGRSFRSPQSVDVIRQAAERLQVHAQVADEHRGTVQVGLAKSRRDRTELRIDGEPGRRLSQAAALLPLQVMVPSLSDLVFGSPAERRQWLDWGLFHVKPGYLGTLRSYLHALRQRNAALKAMAGGALQPRELEVWTEEAARLGEAVAEERAAYLAELIPEVVGVARELTPSMAVAIEHRRGWSGDQGLRKVLGDSVPREVKSGTTQSGPHRGDVALRLAGMPAGAAASRGQGKALASAMMLGQARLLMRTARRASVFLIDDIGAELDLPHSARFFRLLAELGSQILATSNSGPEALRGVEGTELAVFHVEHGRVTRVEP
ncbi:MAG: DNA replication/repair protein RecF [Pseudomonadota bacterium]